MTNHLTLLSNGYSAGYLPRKARTRGNKHHCRARTLFPIALIAGVLTSQVYSHHLVPPLLVVAATAVILDGLATTYTGIGLVT